MIDPRLIDDTKVVISRFVGVSAEVHPRVVDNATSTKVYLWLIEIVTKVLSRFVLELLHRFFQDSLYLLQMYFHDSLYLLQRFFQDSFGVFTEVHPLLIKIVTEVHGTSTNDCNCYNGIYGNFYWGTQTNRDTSQRTVRELVSARSVSTRSLALISDSDLWTSREVDHGPIPPRPGLTSFHRLHKQIQG